jgi:hypothetical protein
MWAIAIFAVIVFIADLVVHVAAMLGFNPQDWVRPGWLGVVLFYGVFGVMVAALLLREILRKRRARLLGEVAGEEVNPFWFKVVIGIVAAYAMITSVDVIFRATGGELSHPEPGVYMADPGHGHPIERISEGQYDRYRRNEVRLVSGIFLIIYLQIAFYFFCSAMGKSLDCAQGTGENPGGAVWVVWRRSRSWSSKGDGD